MKSSKSIIEPYLKRTDWRTKENSNSPECYGGMNKYICGEVSKDYWLREVYTEDIAQAYVNGYVHIHDLGGLTLYTYFGKETIIVKDPNGNIKLTSFEMLYNSLIENEVCVDASRGVFCVYVKGYQVLDKDGWTQITRLTRKEKHRDMKFIKNEQGRSVIVTDNHPMLTKAVGDDDITTKESKDVLEEDDYLYSADVQKLLKDETLFYKDTLDLCEIMPQTVGRKTVYFNGFDRKLLNNYNNIKYVNTISDRLPRYIKLDSEFGFLVGFIIAEGSFTKDSTIGAISLVNKNYDDLMRCCNALDNIGCPYSVTFDENREMYGLYIGNSLFSYILRVVFNILPYSKNKTLPIDILTYSKDFVKGVISGVIDGDGNSNNTQVTIRTASRTLMEQIATLLPFIGLFGRDRAIEGQGTEHIFNGKVIHQNYPLYGVSFRKKESDCLYSRKYDETITSKSNWRTEELDNWSKVLNLKDVNISDDYIYDITTESHTLLVNGMYNHNCCGYSLRDILLKGVRGVQNIPTSAPAKHFDSVLNQIGNLLTVFQNEIMGAVALNSFDTLLAPFIKSDNLTYSQVKQNMQNFIYSINSNSRMGAEPAFSNLTFDLTPPQDLLDEYVIIGGELASFTYRSCQQEMDMLNRAFFEIMLEGDSEHKLFAYPIPTYNIHKRFDWDNPNNRLLWELAGKYGTPYFANYLNSDMNPEDARSMCPLDGKTNIVYYSETRKKWISRDIKSIYADIQDSKHINTIKTLANGQIVNCKINKFNISADYTIELINGLKIKTTGNHLNKVYGKDYVQTKDLTTNDYLPIYNRPTNLSDYLSYEQGKIIGMFLGDGSHSDNNSVIFSLNRDSKQELIDFIYDYTQKNYYAKISEADCISEISGKNSCVNIRVSSKSLKEFISQFVVGNNALEKYLSADIIGTSEDFRRGIVDGLYATDGGNRNRIYTSSEKMVDSLLLLFASLGTTARVNVDERDGRLGDNPNYCVRFYTPSTRNKLKDVYIIDDNYIWFKIKNISYCHQNSASTSYCLEILDNDMPEEFMLANGIVTHNCRLRLDLTELRKRNGGLFGSGDSTGSIGVVTINLPRIAYESQNDKDQFYKKLDYYLDIAKDSLVIKRKWLQENILDKNQIPAFMEYVGTIDNHFSTIGIVGMNEMCENFFDDHSNILSEKGKAFSEEVGAYIRNKLLIFQEETGSLFNYEATPAESTCYRLALADKKVHEDIITQGSGKDCYYTNSCHIPVKYIEGLDSTFKHQETLQSQFTGGTVIHLYMEGAISGEQAKSIIKSTFTNYTIPYVSISPISRYCEDHGYIEEHVDKCPICKKRLKKYQRITGYLRCIDNFNRGKRAEFEDRKQLNVAENNN